MESESKHDMQKLKEKLEVSDILKEAVIIFFTNVNFIIFTLLISLPFFSLMVYFETCLQQTLIETSEILNLPTISFTYYGSIVDFQMRDFTINYCLKLILLGFIYLVPLHLLELCSAIITINLASELRSEDTKMSLKEMFQIPISISILRGTLLTSIYVLLFSTSYLFGLLWIVINYQVFFKNLSYYLIFAVICSLAFSKLLRVYLEWSAMWNMSIVISVLEGVYGIEALVLSAYFSRGCQRRGLLLMLIFFAWGHFLRLFCLYIGGYKERNGVAAQVGLFCLANLLKWVVCMIYFYDCKERSLEKKVDEELGQDVTVVHE
ncbi:transmembrane protein [Senna tora]|uniref:Transmembrane protein n=1 Tax=Senna tora TaxID=362788 RepID=A0A834SV54_9FABA|nr:transmembrane protein [Senna tora]